VKVRRRHGVILVSLDAAEVFVVRTLAEQTAELVAPSGAAADDPLEAMVGAAGEAVAPPDDPAVRRLLPDAYADPADAGEFRRLMDDELRRTKHDALCRLAADLGADEPVALSLGDDDVEQWVQALNDVRLVLGTRLDVTDDVRDTWNGMEADDPRLPLVLAYDLLTYLQQELLEALDAG
jgi:hypothetical protein